MIRSMFALVGFLAMNVLATGQENAGKDDFKAFQGTWIATTGTLRQLTIKPNGQFLWLAQQGNARAEGDGQMRKEGADFVLTIEFRAKETMRIKLIEKGTKIELVGKDGKAFEMSAGK